MRKGVAPMFGIALIMAFLAIKQAGDGLVVSAVVHVVLAVVAGGFAVLLAGYIGPGD